MSLSIEELRRQKEQLDRERELLEQQLLQAERREREAAAQEQLAQLVAQTARIDALKAERRALLDQIRAAVPHLGDYSYAQDDDRLTLSWARTTLKQPELLDKLLEVIRAGQLHIEPRTPRFRLFRALRPVGTLQVHPRRLVVVVTEPVLDGTLLTAVDDLNQRYPGLAVVSWETERRLCADVAGRRDDGRYAASIQFTAGDTGSLDAVLPLLAQALDHGATFAERQAAGETSLLFEPMSSAEPVTVDAPATAAS